MNYKRSLMLIGILLVVILSMENVRSFGAEAGMKISATPKVGATTNDDTNTGNGMDSGTGTTVRNDDQDRISTNVTFVGSIVRINHEELSERMISQYRTDLGLNESIPVENNTVREMDERKRENYSNYRRLKLLVRKVNVERRALFLGELIGMDQNFTSRMSDEYEDSSVKNQVENYLDVVNEAEEIKPKITKNVVKNLLGKTIDREEFIMQLLG